MSGIKNTFSKQEALTERHTRLFLSFAISELRAVIIHKTQGCACFARRPWAVYVALSALIRRAVSALQ